MRQGIDGWRGDAAHGKRHLAEVAGAWQLAGGFPLNRRYHSGGDSVTGTRFANRAAMFRRPSAILPLRVSLPALWSSNRRSRSMLFGLTLGDGFIFQAQCLPPYFWSED